MAVNLGEARSVHDVTERIGFDQAKLDEKGVGSAQGELVILLIRVVVKEGVTCVLKFHELAVISALAVAFCEFFRVLNGDDAVGLAVEDEAGREVFLREVA